jgi:hypothetical protein
MGEEQQPREEPAAPLRPSNRLGFFWLAALPILLLACLLRFWALDLGLPHKLARPDEDDVLEMTALPAQGEFDLGWSVYPSAYVYLCWAWGEVGLRAERALGIPTGDYVATLRREPSRVFRIARSLSAVAGVGAVWLLMVLARRSLGDPAALGAGLLLATNFLHARDSHVVKPDALLALGVTAALLAMLPLARRATLRSGALAGLGVGGAMAAKYPGVVLLVPVYVAAFVQSAARGWRRFAPLPAVVAGAVAAFVFLALSPYLLLSRESLQGIEHTIVLAFPFLFPERTAEAMATFRLLEDPAPLSEYGSRAWWGGLYYQARFSLWYGAGKVPTLLAPLALVWAFTSRRRIAILAASFILPYFLIIALSPPALLARYMTPLLPPLLLLEAGMLHGAARRWAGRRAGLVFALAILVVAVEPLMNTVGHNRIAAETDTRVLATRWLREHIAPGSRVAVYGTRFYPWGSPVVPRRLVRVEVEPEVAALEENRIEYLVTHDHALFYSTTAPEVMERLAPRLSLEADFFPFDPGHARPIFEAADAYYIPFHGFTGVERPGPRVRLYRFGPASGP